MPKRKRFLSLAQFKALPRDRQGNIINLLDHACRFKDVYLNWLTTHDLNKLVEEEL